MSADSLSSKRKLCESNNKQCCIKLIQRKLQYNSSIKEYGIPAQWLGPDVAATAEVLVALA